MKQKNKEKLCEKQEIKEIINERMGQIYKNFMNNNRIKKLKKTEEIAEEKIEIYLKERKHFNIFLQYEEARSEYLNELFKEYYKKGFKDGMSIIIKNM